MNAKLKAYGELMRLDRPVGTLLLLWPTLAALWLAGDGQPPTAILIAFIAGTFVMRAAGCVINDLADRNIDPNVERTKGRPLADGRIGATEALVLFAALGLLAFLIVLTLNVTTRWLAVAGIAIVLIYPFMKRYTYMPQVVLGAAFSWGIPMAGTAITGTVSQSMWVYFVASVFWIVAYDTLYAMVDRRDDLEAGVKSTAILFADNDRLIIGVLQASVVLLLWLLGLRQGFEHVYYVALLTVIGLFGYQQRLIRKREETMCFRAFLNNVWVGFAIFGGVVAEYTVAYLSP